MPIQHAIWRVGDQPAPLASSKLASEQQLESMIVREPRILSSAWMLIGQQEVTGCNPGSFKFLTSSAPSAFAVLPCCPPVIGPYPPIKTHLPHPSPQ